MGSGCAGSKMNIFAWFGWRQETALRCKEGGGCKDPVCALHERVRH